MPVNDNEQDKMATILKAQGLHSFAKMSVNIGKVNMEKIVAMTRYAESLTKPRSYPFLGLNKPIAFFDAHALERIKYDPIYGFVWYYQEKGEMETFGELVRAEGMASDVPLGTASEVAAVIPTSQGKMPTVVTKKELGMNDQTTQEMLVDFRKFQEKKTEVIDEEHDIIKRDVPNLVRFEGETKQTGTLPPWARRK
jgi:hypothetical protein